MSRRFREMKQRLHVRQRDARGVRHSAIHVVQTVTFSEKVFDRSRALGLRRG
jgi:hypothetical protein